MKNQGNIALPKEDSKPPVTCPREMEIQGLSDKELNINNCSTVLEELQRI